MKKLLQPLILVLLVGFAGCSGKEAVVPQNGSTIPLVIQTNAQLETAVEVSPGVFIKPSTLKFYLSTISFKTSDGAYVFAQDAMLFDQEDGSDTISLVIPNGATQISFGIGVPQGTNTGDPTTYPNSHPYSVKGSNGMHWSWNTGYRFVVYEGKRDSSLTGNFTDPFAFHTGTDSLYKTVSYPLPDGVTAIKIALDVTKLFTNIDLKKEYETHTVGNPDLARRFTNNFAGALTVTGSTK